MDISNIISNYSPAKFKEASSGFYSMEYEFSDKDALVISRTGFRLLTQAILLLGAGIFGIFFYVFSQDLSNLDNIVIFLQSIVEIIIFVALFTVPGYLKKVKTTEGSDVSQLIAGLRKMSKGFMIVWIAVIVNLVLDVILIVTEA